MIYLFFGDNDFAKSLHIRELVDEFKQKHGELNVEHLDGEEISPEELQNLTSQSLFSTERLVVVESFGVNTNSVQLLTEVIEQIPSSTKLIFSERKVKKTSRFYKLITKHGEVRQFASMPEHEAVGWVVKFAEKVGGKATNAEARLLVQRVGANQMKLSNEIRKLVAYEPELNTKNIELMVEKRLEENVFELLDLITAGKTKQARDRYRQLRDGLAEPYYIMSMIAWQLNNMAIVGVHKGKSADEIASEATISPFVVQKTLRVTNRLPLNTIASMISLAAATDMALKTTAAQPDQLVEQLIDRLSLMSATR